MINEENVKKIADLSKIEIEDRELNKFQLQLNKILKVIENLRNLNTKDIDPLYSPLEKTNYFRPDEVEKSKLSKDILKSSSFYKDEKLVVPKVI